MRLFTIGIHFWGFLVLGLTIRCCLSWWLLFRLVHADLRFWDLAGSINGVEMAAGGGGGHVVVLFSVFVVCRYMGFFWDVVVFQIEQTQSRYKHKVG